MAGPARHPDSRRVRFLVADEAADRCGPGCHECPGADQRVRPRPHADRNREAGHGRPGNSACRHAGSGIDALVFPQRVRADHHGLRRPHQYLFRPAIGGRAPQRRQGQPAAGRRCEDGAGVDRPRRSLLVGSRIRKTRRVCADTRRPAGLAKRWKLSHPRGRAPHGRFPAYRPPSDRAGLDRAAADEDGAGGGRRGRHRRLRETISGPA